MNIIDGFIKYLNSGKKAKHQTKNKNTIYGYRLALVQLYGFIKFGELYTQKMDKSRRNEIKQFCKGNLSEVNITQKLIDEFTEQIETTYKQNARIPKMASIRNFLRYIERTDIKCKMYSPKQTRTEVLTEEQFQELFEATKDKPLENAIIKTFTYSALRRDEVIALDITDIDFDKKTVTIRNGKGTNGQAEFIIVHDDAIKSIQRYIKETRATFNGEIQPLFLTPNKTTRIDRNTIRKIVKESAINTTIKHIYPHMFRASILTIMASNGGDVLQLKSLSRHKSLASLNVYVRPNAQQKQRIYDTLVPTIGEKKVPTETDTRIKELEEQIQKLKKSTETNENKMYQ